MDYIGLLHKKSHMFSTYLLLKLITSYLSTATFIVPLSSILTLHHLHAMSLRSKILWQPSFQPEHVNVLNATPPKTTLPETNVAPENGWLEDFLVSFWDGHFFRCYISFREGNMSPHWCFRYFRWNLSFPGSTLDHNYIQLPTKNHTSLRTTMSFGEYCNLFFVQSSHYPTSLWGPTRDIFAVKHRQEHQEQHFAMCGFCCQMIN